jgi:mannose-6-phosphate isomerase-like protein (cupin superfamily)
MLSKIETGRTEPTVAMLTKIAAALGVTVSALLAEDTAGGTTVVTPAASTVRRNMPASSKGYSYCMFAPGLHHKLIEPYLFVLRKGRIRKGAVSHDGEEFVYVLKGRMKYRVGGNEYTLGPGDSIYFNALDEHDFVPLTNEVRYLGVFATKSAGKWWEDVKHAKRR